MEQGLGNKKTKNRYNKWTIKPSNLFMGLLFTLFFISVGVICAVNFKFIYYADINFLNIVETSGYSKEVIKENYDALIEYNSPFFQGDLVFPSLPSSPEGTQHFVEVKNIFVAFYYIFAVTLVLLIITILMKYKKNDFSYLKTSAITVIVLPIIVVAACAIDFDKAFVIFHKIFFRNDYWLFDPRLDPVINILPDTFFLHSLLVIIGFVILGCVGLFLVNMRVKKKEGR